MRIIILNFLFCIFLISDIYAQTSSNRAFSDEKDFIIYLTNNKFYDKQLTLLKSFRNEYNVADHQEDTLNYYLGFTFYKLANYDSSIFYFSKVDNECPIFQKGAFYLSDELIAGNQLNKAEKVLTDFQDSTLRDLSIIYLSGISLLQRNYNEYLKEKDLYSNNSQELTYLFENFNIYSDQLSSIKRKSPFLAGLFSAFIPGSGKAYAGKPLSGISNFTSIAIFGVQTYEGLVKGGVKSPQFILFGSVFTTFYIANIWGSILSVKVREREKYEEIDHKIRTDLRIALHQFLR